MSLAKLSVPLGANPADDLPDLAPDGVFLQFLGWIGVPFVVLLILSALFAAAAWKETIRQATDSYAKASSFIQRKREDLAWQLPILAVAQALFIAAACCTSQLLSWLHESSNGYVHNPLSYSRWAGIATSFDHVSEPTKTVAAIALIAALAIDFLVVTGRHDALEFVLGVVAMPGASLAVGYAVIVVIIGFLTSYDGDPAFATGYYISAGILVVTWAALSAAAFAAREFTDS